MKTAKKPTTKIFERKVAADYNIKFEYTKGQVERFLSNVLNGQDEMESGVNFLKSTFVQQKKETYEQVIKWAEANTPAIEMNIINELAVKLDPNQYLYDWDYNAEDSSFRFYLITYDNQILIFVLKIDYSKFLAFTKKKKAALSDIHNFFLKNITTEKKEQYLQALEDDCWGVSLSMLDKVNTHFSQEAENHTKKFFN